MPINRQKIFRFKTDQHSNRSFEQLQECIRLKSPRWFSARLNNPKHLPKQFGKTATPSRSTRAAMQAHAREIYTLTLPAKQTVVDCNWMADSISRRFNWSKHKARRLEPENRTMIFNRNRHFQTINLNVILKHRVGAWSGGRNRMIHENTRGSKFQQKPNQPKPKQWGWQATTLEWIRNDTTPEGVASETACTQQAAQWTSWVMHAGARTKISCLRSI